MKKNNCSICNVFSELQEGNFSLKTGERLYRTYCKKCYKEKRDVQRAATKDEQNKRKKAWAIKNPEKVKEIKQKNRLKYKEKYTQQRSLWKKSNKTRVNIYTAKRRKRLQQATPKWLSEWDWFYIEELYHLSMLRNQEVDHIIPLTNPIVCGLHVPWNLQLLSKSENSKKGNKFFD